MHKQLQWRRRKKSLMELTRKMKKQDKELSLSIAKADGSTGGMLKVCVRHLQLRTLKFKPRRNSFEVTLMEGDKEVVLWTGIKKGPPRKLKFPDPAEVVSALKEALKS
ncbi:Selenoprotein H [Labeo rohita]|uniref:Selenoprotein H n=1 Tax=Labeo rohita TaxID=84645 RepID=A0ABQ8M2W0_LABRO|nr:Selenoprotein H [Labeo rohita]